MHARSRTNQTAYQPTELLQRPKFQKDIVKLSDI